MKKNLFKTLFVVSLLVSIKSIKAQCSLDQVGAVNFVTTSALSDVAIAPNKVLYTIAYNTSVGKYQLHSGMTSSSWTLTATLTGSTTIKPAIHINDAGKVSIFVRDDNAGGVGKVYYLSGAVFVQQGASVATGAVTNLCMTSDLAGDEYIAYTDVANGNKSTVKKWNSGSSVWSLVGTTVSPGVGAYNSLIVTGSDMPVLAFQDGTQTNKTTVMKYNGASWVSIGTLGANATNSKIKLASNGDFYLGYTETGGNTVVQKFDGASWTPVGSAIGGLSSGNVFDLELDPVDVPYITGILGTPPYPVAYKYTGVPTWSNVIGSGYLNSATSVNPNIEIDYTGTPYFFYVDQPANNALNVKTLSSTINISSHPISVTRCNGQSGSFSVGTVGGVPSYQWQMSAGGIFTNASAPYTNVTTNSVGFTAASSMNQDKLRCVVNVGCKNIISNTATLTVITPSVSLVTTNPTCFGGNDGMIVSTPSGGVGPYTYSWSPGSQSTSSITGQYAGTYSVTSTDINGCSASSTGNLVNPPQINTSFTGNMTICNGANTTLTITASNGVPAYTYSWSPGASLSSTTSSVVTANPTSTQTYTVTVTDSNGCVATNTVMVTVNALPSVSAGVDNTICNGGSTMNMATGAHTYTWNPGNFVGANQNVTPFTTTTYTVVGTNTLTGCANSDTKMVTVNPNPTVNAVSNPTVICAGSASTLTASGAISYTWNPGSITGTTITVTPTITTTYTVTGMAATGCSNTKTVTLNVNPNPTVTAVSNPTAICVGSASTLTASGATTYTWIPGSLTGSNVVVTPTASTIYTVTGTTAAGCTNTKTLSLTVNTNPVATASTSGTLTCSVTTVGLNAGPAAGATYLWSGPGVSGPPTVQNTSANLPGNYTVTVTNSGTGCSATAVTSVTQNTTTPSPTASNSGTLTCTIFTVSVTGTGGGTYSWSGPGIISGGATSSATVNQPGVYSLTVTSANGCSATATTAVNQNTTAPSVTAGTTGTLTCSTFTVALNGGPAGMNYSWTGPGISGSPTSQNTAANGPGIFNLSVTNPINGCSASATTAVTQNTAAPSTSASTTGTLTCSTSSITLNGGPAGMTYLWSGPGISGSPTTQNTTANAPGTYTLSVTNSTNGCMASATTAVTQNTIAPSATANTSGTLTCSASTVALNGGPAGMLYSWTGPGVSGSPTTQNTAANAPGTYTLSVTNSVNGCMASATTAVSQNTAIPSPTTSNTGPLTCNTITVSLNGTPGAGVTYLWSGPGITGSTTTQNTTANAAGIYTLSVTNSVNGCSASATTAVSQNTAAPSVTSSVTNSLTCTNATANAMVSTIASPVIYNWTGSGIISGATTATITTNTSGIKNYTVTNTSNGCAATGTVVISQNTVMPAGLSAGTNQTITCASPSVTLNGSISTPTNASISWAGGVCGTATTLVTNACAPGIYTLTAVDVANGCSASSTVQVNSSVGVPVINANPTGTLTCSNTTLSISITTTSTPVDILWSGPGIVSGSTTLNPTINQPGTYSVTVTNTVTGCSSSVNLSVTQDITLPTITIAASPSVICSGNTSTLTATGAITYVWSTGPTSASIVVSPSGSTTYTVTGTGTNGCSDITTQLITVNTTPILSVTGNTNICNGSTSNLAASGATSYTWDTGANTSTISVTPSVTTTYTLTGDNGNGCSSSLMITVSIIPAKNISGVITSTTGAVTGDVILYKYVSALSQWDSVTTVPFTNSYSFSAIDSALYVVRAVPSATNIQVTYGDSAISWQDATVITHGCTNNSTQNIKLIALQNFIVGPGIITGVITEGNGFGQKMNNEFKPLVPGTPIGGIVVKGGKNPGGQMFVQTITDAAGQYTLTGLPLNSGSDSYFIFVDIPGLDTNGTYHLVVSTGNTQFTNMNFYVDSMYIHPNSVTFINQENTIAENKINVFPNPARQSVSIQYELLQSAEVQIELFDIIGNKIESVSNSQQEKNKYAYKINTEQFSSGVYFIRMRINNSENTIKLIITE